ncbi:MAG TPA: hypothetical protein VGA53_00545 [Candidatus Paceibacterota bacterium]
MAGDLKQLIQETAKATAKEVRKEFDLVIEDLEQGTLKAISEQLDMHTKQLNGMDARLGNVESRLENVDARLGAIETTLVSGKPAKSKGLPFLKPNYENS